MKKDGKLSTIARCAMLLAAAAMCGVGTVCAQTTSFTYQGRLTDGGTAANGNYDLQFALFDSLSGGTQVGSQTVPTVAVSAGIFTVQLDFGANAFPGASRFLEISARLSGSGAFPPPLSPRQPITSTPYAIRSLNASTAEAVTVNGVPSGSGNYVQNTTTTQASANFNISGNGAAGGTLSGNVVNATTQYNLGGERILGTAGQNNLFVGLGAGQSNTGSGNAFFGWRAGVLHESGINNAFFGADTGSNNTSGDGNSFFGQGAGQFNNLGKNNSFFGLSAGRLNVSGNNNTLMGWAANVGTSNLTNATAIGAFAQVNRSNSLVLGSIAGVNLATASANVGIGTTFPQATLDVVGTMLVSDSVGIGTTTPQASLDVNGAGVFRPAGVASPRAVSFAGPSGETGMTINGPNNRADVRFDGQTLRLVAGVGTGPPPSTNGVAIDVTSGNVAIGQVSSSPTSIHVCLDFANRLAFCSSSLRFKENVAPFSIGLELIRRLRPISFTWKNNGTRDLGLGAEDVAKVEPLLVTHNDKGEIQGVKYDQLNVVLINAIKQQQAQIEQQQEQIARQETESRQQRAALRVQQQQIDALKKLACRSHRRSGVCR